MKQLRLTIILLFLILNQLFTNAQWIEKFNTSDLIWDMDFFTPTTGIIVGTDYNNYSTCVYRTTNGGINWTKINTGDTMPTAFAEVTCVNSTIAYVGGTVLLKTLNAGATWNSINFIINCKCPGPENYFQDIEFYSEMTGFAIWKNVLLKTNDGGITWDSLRPAKDPGYNSIFVLDNNNVFVSVLNHFLVTNNGGNTWTDYTNTSIGLPFYKLNSIYFHNQNKGFALSDDCLYTTNNGGSSWTKVTVPYTSNTLLTLDFVNSTTGLISGEIELTFKTEDGGSTWKDCHKTGSIIKYSMGKCKMLSNNTAVAISSHIDKSWVYVNSDITSAIQDDNSGLNNLDLYPNPAGDFIFIERNKNINLHATYQIFNLQNELIKTGTLNFETQTQIDISGISAGIYFIRIIDQPGITLLNFIKE